MKNLINWNYSRGSWQYDLLCLFIIGLIFLTPRFPTSNQSLDATSSTLRDVKNVQSLEAQEIARVDQIKTKH